jgi:hypothetical protein
VTHAPQPDWWESLEQLCDRCGEGPFQSRVPLKVGIIDWRICDACLQTLKGWLEDGHEITDTGGEHGK